MSRGGAAHRRSKDSTPALSTRVTAPSTGGQPRRTNWIAVALIVLVLVGLIGGFFVSMVSTSPSVDTTPTSTSPP